MANYFVSCHTPDNSDPDRRIQGLGSYGPSGYQWFPIDTIILMIDRGDVFQVQVGGVWTLVVVRKHTSGKRYLTTVADGFPPNNLLSLPRCP